MVGLDKVKIDNIIFHFTGTNERIADAIICNDKVKIDNIIFHFTGTNERIADAIICNDEETWKKIYDYVTERLDNHFLFIPMEYRNYHQVKYFLRKDNGSTLTVMTASVAIGPRGRRYTRMLVDDRINKEDIDYALRPLYRERFELF